MCSSDLDLESVFLYAWAISVREAGWFGFGEAALFIALRDGAPVGRISAHVNRMHQRTHASRDGHFGFFDCLDDQEAADALFSAATGWLRGKGCDAMIGPMNFTINEECGLQVDGFETPPAVCMTQARPWTGRLVEKAGLFKEMDLFAYRMKPAEAGPKVHRLAQLVKSADAVRLRHAEMNHFRRELDLVVDIFNEAWKDNWGFCPISADELETVIGELRHFFKGNCVRFVLLDEQPVGVMVVLPDYNEMIHHFEGRLFPFNWAKLAWRLWREDVRSARVVLLGLRDSVRGGAKGASILALLVESFLAESRKYALDWVEFSWILETNKAMRSLAEFAAGPPAKTYRIYKRAL